MPPEREAYVTTSSNANGRSEHYVRQLRRGCGHEALRETPRRPPPSRSRIRTDGIYACRGEDAWIAISIRDGVYWQRFAECVGTEALKASNLAHAAGRRAAEELIDRVISKLGISARGFGAPGEAAWRGYSCRLRSVDGRDSRVPRSRASNYFIPVEQPEGIGPVPNGGHHCDAIGHTWQR
jgi:hypothetical protein